LVVESGRFCREVFMHSWHVLLVTRAIGLIFTGLFVGMWAAFFRGKMDTGGVIFISIIAVFAIPLLIGSVLALRGRRSGFWFLKFGSVLILFKPTWFVQLWKLEQDPEFHNYLARMGVPLDDERGVR
jgi:hypothetical protein